MGFNNLYSLNNTASQLMQTPAFLRVLERFCVRLTTHPLAASRTNELHGHPRAI